VIGADRLTFTTTPPKPSRAEVVFVCVGTPPLPGGGPNLSFVEAVGRNVVANATGDLVLVEKSTVPANTGRRLEQVIARERQRLDPAARDPRRVQPGVPQGGRGRRRHAPSGPGGLRHLERRGT
jgi:UDP-glucose 6-dehydrogenase